VLVTWWPAYPSHDPVHHRIRTLSHPSRLHCLPIFHIQGPRLGAQCMLYSLVADCGHRARASALRTSQVLQFRVMFLESAAWGFALTRYLVRLVGIRGHGGFFNLLATAGMSSPPFSLIFLSVLVPICPILQFPCLCFSFLHDGQSNCNNPSPSV
jgi:hypothetical protein